MLRNMRRPPIPLFVFRDNKWELSQSDEIFPGDLISLSNINININRRGGSADRREEEKIVPCDALLVRGNCVVNEVDILMMMMMMCRIE